MEPDSGQLPSSTTTEGKILIGSNSTPMINVLGDNSQMFPDDTLRTRRNSVTFMTGHCLFLPPAPTCTSIRRIHQIKKEECMDLRNREAKHEWEMQSTMQLIRSLEEFLNLNDDDSEKPSSPKHTDLIPVSSGTSARGEIEKHCFSPPLQTCVSRTTLPTSSIPSTTQRFTVRRLSSNIIRPSILGSLKRKGETAFEEQTKRVFLGPGKMFSDTIQLPDINECVGEEPDS